MKKRMTSLLLVTFALGACITTGNSVENYLSRKNIAAPTKKSIPHCHGYGCQYVENITLTPQEWKATTAPMQPKFHTPEEERAAIAQTIGLFEQKIGALAGTDEDIHGTFIKTGRNQLDCVDESTNTTVYLSLLEKRGLLKFHRVEAPTVRLPLLNSGRWPHQTAVISEIESSKFFAVDSWFHDNGAPAEIVELRQWKDGWKPQKEE